MLNLALSFRREVTRGVVIEWTPRTKKLHIEDSAPTHVPRRLVLGRQGRVKQVPSKSLMNQPTVDYEEILAVNVNVIDQKITA